MTRAELEAAWVRYMHRNDLAQDLSLTYDLASQRVNERLTFKTVSIDDILANNPRSLLHAGLLQLAELAHDDVQMQREGTLFESAIADFSFRTSLNNTTPMMARPYYPEDAADAS